MWNQESYQNAIDFAAKKHKEQKVPGKEYSYVVHLSNVAAEAGRAMFEEPPEDPDLIIQAALLHDVLEDTEATEEELSSRFGKDVSAVVKALTKNQKLEKSERMADSLERIIAVGKPAAIVKLCDRITNLQEPPKHWDSEKCAAYLQEAELIHSKLAGFHDYLGNRLEKCMAEYRKYI